MSMGIFLLLTVVSFVAATTACDIYSLYKNRRTAAAGVVIWDMDSEPPRFRLLRKRCSCCADRAGGMRTGAFAEIARSRKRSLPKLAARDSCAICMEEFGDMPKAQLCEINRCGHVFCKGCIHQWLRRSDACPLCKQEIC